MTRQVPFPEVLAHYKSLPMMLLMAVGDGLRTWQLCAVAGRSLLIVMQRPRISIAKPKAWFVGANLTG